MTTTKVPEKIATLLASCTLVPLAGGRPRTLRLGDRCNLVIDGQYYPCCVEAVEGGALAPESSGVVTLRAIVLADFVSPLSGTILELREGPDVFGQCELRSVVSVI